MATLLLTSCGGSDVAELTVRAPADAPLLALQLTGGGAPQNRPSALLGIYGSLFLSQGLGVPSRAALLGVQAIQALTRPLNPDQLEDAYTLLQEFGSVLQVEVPEMLNAQTDRALALNQYVTGLKNITVRANLKAQEIENAAETREETRRTEQRALADVRSQIQKALREKDYATAGALQAQRNTAQAALERTQSEIGQLQEVSRIYRQLLDIAQERIVAIEQNRAVLLSGLQVVEVPGVEDLDVLLQGRAARERLRERQSDGAFSTDSLEGLPGVMF